MFRPQNTLIAEAGVGWSPRGLTTVNATVSRETGDAAQEGVSGLVYSAARLTIDHEYLRNLLFRASLGLQRADFFQGGHQSGTTAGFGMTWVMNRSARLSLPTTRPTCTDLASRQRGADDRLQPRRRPGDHEAGAVTMTIVVKP